MHDTILANFQESISVKQAVLRDPVLLNGIAQAAVYIIESLKSGGKIMFVGNGGSAADAQHLAGELVSRFYYDRPALAGLALTTDTSILTAIGNDYGYEQTFSRQVLGLGRVGDILVALTTSGNSANILTAVATAKTLGIRTLGMTGQSGGALLAQADLCLRVPSSSTPRIQECHITIGHILCALAESACHPKKNA
jgi:D-sedoheptulose 7-phosphate isomerase